MSQRTGLGEGSAGKRFCPEGLGLISRARPRVRVVGGEN